MNRSVSVVFFAGMSITTSDGEAENAGVETWEYKTQELTAASMESQ